MLTTRSPFKPSDFNHPLPLEERLRLALHEDLSERGDVTTDAVFPPEAMGRARVVAKADGVLAGLEVFVMVFNMTGTVHAARQRADGDPVRKGDEILVLEGHTRGLLKAERTALNLLQRLSGIATLTAKYVAAANGQLVVCDTRKTTPLWRDLEKYAVRCGGGMNHRMGLYDMVMLKDTHADGAGSLANALVKVSSLRPGLRVAAEARNLAEVEAALAQKVDLLMLDNMDEATLRLALKRINSAAQTEVTGNMTPERTRELAALGIDRVSAGALTHSAAALDFSMRLELL